MQSLTSKLARVSKVRLKADEISRFYINRNNSDLKLIHIFFTGFPSEHSLLIRENLEIKMRFSMQRTGLISLWWKALDRRFIRISDIMASILIII